MYTAAILNPVSAGLLRWIVKAHGLENKGFSFKTPQNTEVPHHMTINLGPIDVNLNDEEILEKPALLHVDQIVWSHEIGACAARVVKAEVEMRKFPAIYWETIDTINAHKHITICLKNGVKPFLSNKLFESDSEIIQLDEVYKLDAVVDVCA
jgi:hypothetical protein